jgi:hypothetical protein
MIGVPGYVITAPDKNIDAIVTVSKDFAEIKLQELKLKSKWPEFVCLRNVWLFADSTWVPQ